MAMLADLARELEIPFSHAALRAADVAAADEVLLCSTSACVWPVQRFNGQAIGTGQPGEVRRQLIDAWSQHVGVDIVLQARNASEARRTERE
jgi:branched-subunit amino acid aminotransferase/4-amino-4-deoxychorismate lyase